MRDYLAETAECLERYLESKSMLESKITLLIRLRKDRCNKEREISIPSAQYDEIPAKTNKVSSKVEEIAIKNIQLELDLEEEIDSLTYYINRIDIKMAELKEEWQQLIRLKYIEGNTWEYIAYKTGQSESTCRREARKALEALMHGLVGEKSYIDLPLFRYIYIESKEEIEQA